MSGQADDWSDWELTRAATEGLLPEWLSDDDDEDLAPGFSLLRTLAAEPDSHLVELRPGVWYDPKLPESGG